MNLDWARKNCEKRTELIKENPVTQIDRDIWNLKWVLYGIGKYSLWYRMGIVKTLRRAIKLLESEKERQK